MTTLANLPTITLKAGREKPVRQGHPWIFSGAIETLPPVAQAADGDLVAVLDSRGQWLAQGYLNRRSQIQVRILSWDQTETIDDDFWRGRLAQAIAGRADLAEASPATTVYRLINAENDYLPGLTVDRYADYLVLQSGTLGMDRYKVRLAQLLMELTGCAGVIERSEVALRREEGLGAATGVLAGTGPDGLVTVHEAGLGFLVDIVNGQKSGFYADQRENRMQVAALCKGKRMLNAFSYTGGFGIHALAAGADHVVNVDSSVEALTLGEENFRLNGFDPDGPHAESIAGDLFQILREWRDEPEQHRFDVIVLDPPKFAHNKKTVNAALRGYKDINLLAMNLIQPGGILATFSCSGLVSPDLFQKVIFGAAVDAGRQVQILAWLHQSSDHPTAITFPEGNYLKGLLCRVL